jgi:hypothetical protein
MGGGGGHYRIAPHLVSLMEGALLDSCSHICLWHAMMAAVMRSARMGSASATNSSASIMSYLACVVLWVCGCVGEGGCVGVWMGGWVGEWVGG